MGQSQRRLNPAASASRMQSVKVEHMNCSLENTKSLLETKTTFCSITLNNDLQGIEANIYLQ